MLENQQNLTINEDQFKKIFKALSTPTYIWKKIDKDLILIDYNDAANEIVNGKMKDLLGIRATKLYKDNPQILEDLTRCLNGEIVLSKEILYKYRSLDLEKKFLVSYKFIPPDLIIVHIDDITKQKELEDSLKKSEREKSVIFENIPEFIVFQDDQHNIIWANKAACDSVSLTLEDLIGRKCYNIWHNNNKIIQNCPVDAALKLGKNVNGEITSPDGTIWDIRVYLVKDENNKIVGVIELTIDITERRNAEKELKKKQLALESIFRAAPVGIGEVVNRAFTQVNDRFCDLVGYDRKELIGKSARIVYLTDEDYEFVGRVKYDLIKKFGLGTVETRFLRKDGKILDILLSSAMNDIKNPLAGVTFTALDITDRKKVEEKYRKAYHRNNFYKDLFTHDINNILQNLLSSVELSNLFSTDPSKIEKIKEVSNLISEQIIRGKKLVSNVQKLSEVDEIMMPILSVEASQVLTKAIEFLRVSFPHKTLNIQIESFQKQYFIIANNLLINLFENLLFNAVKHNNHKKIEILIRISREFSKKINFIKFEFIDNGVGIPDLMKDEIFSRDFSEYKKDKVPSGIGLGLLLVKRIMETYNGIIKVEDKIKGDYSKGSNFIILIPEVI